ncbi:MAG TPA: FG-GAP repeat protein [Polyangiaceae bacterium]
MCALACSAQPAPSSGAQTNAATASAATGPKWIEETILSPATPHSAAAGPGAFQAPPVALDRAGARLLVGGPAPSVFVRTGNVWHLEGEPLTTLIPEGGGYNVAISGEVALIGTPSGGLFVFEREEGTVGAITFRRWAERARLENPCAQSGGPAFAMSLSEHTAAVACYQAVHVYARQGATLVPKEKLEPDPGANEGGFGFSIALDANTLVVSSPLPDRNPADQHTVPGRVHVYLRWSGKWYPQHTLMGSSEGFGVAVGLHGDALTVVDADLAAGVLSTVHYARTGSAWTLQHESEVGPVSISTSPLSLAFAEDAVFVALDSSAHAIVRSAATWRERHTLALPLLPGLRLAASTQHAAVSHRDSVTIFERSGSTWRPTQTVGLRAPSSLQNSMSPGNFDLSGTRAALVRDDDGVSQLFSHSGSHWAPTAELEIATEPGYDTRVAISGDDWLVLQNRFGHTGAPRPPRLISGIGSSPARSQELLATDAAILEGGLALSGEVAILGAYPSDAAYVFRRVGTEWKQEAKLTMPGDGEGFEFGRAVAVRGDVAVVGAPRNLISDWMPDPGLMDQPGAAYVFVRSAEGVWRSLPKLSPVEGSNPGFGMGVSLLEGAVAVAAPFVWAEPKHSAGVHVYSLANGSWQPQTVLDAKLNGGDEKELFGFSLDATADTLVVGALGATVPSAAYAYRRVGGEWSFEQRFHDPLDRSFGAYVAASEDRLSIGALRDYPRVFRRAGVKAGGAPCASPDECASKTCLDGVCCSGACDEACHSCAHDLTGGLDGECKPVPAGTRCGADPLTCKSGVRYAGASVCTADGSCDAAPGELCQNNLACWSAGYCAWDCAAFDGPTDELCAAAAWCQAPSQGQPATCVADFVAGEECERPAQCLSGLCEARAIPGCTPRGSDECQELRCAGKQGDPCTQHEHCSQEDNLTCSPDGVCCNEACTGKCESCSEEGKDAAGDPKRGQCLQHDGEPADGHGTCPGTGACKGTCDGEKSRTECVIPTTPCAPAHCAGPNSAKPAAYCNSNGECADPTVQMCGNYSCNEDTQQCNVSCTSEADCAGGACRDRSCTAAVAGCFDTHNWRSAAGSTVRCNGRCEGAACTRDCTADEDCLAGNACIDDRCTEQPDAGSEPETGADSGTHVDSGTGSDGGGEPDPRPSAENTDEAGGCDCRAARGGATGGLERQSALFSLALLFGLAARRRFFDKRRGATPPA